MVPGCGESRPAATSLVSMNGSHSWTLASFREPVARFANAKTAKALVDGQVAHESDGEERQDRDNDVGSGHSFSLER
jgi:hypothetical protein